MKNLERARQITLTVLALFSLAVGQIPSPPAQPVALLVGQAKIVALKGEVSVQLPQAAAADVAQKGQMLVSETVIGTVKGSAVLELADGSQVEVKPNSRVVLKDPAQGKGFWLEQFLGKVLVKIKKRMEGAPSFRMGTPTAVITVRGTEFLVEVTKKGATLVTVYQGIVAVSGIGPDARPVIIGPGFRTDVEPNRAPEIPREIAPVMRAPREWGDDSRATAPGEREDRQTGDRGEREQPETEREHD